MFKIYFLEDKICNKPNEIYSNCVSPCRKTCDNFARNEKCHTSECNPECNCKPGYVRDSRGNCIRYSDCPGKLKKMYINFFLRIIHFKI